MSQSQSQFTTCSIQIIQRDGGSITLDGNQVLSVTVSKNIRSGTETATIALPPNTPFSNDDMDWVEIFAPMSLVVIGMSRGTNASTVFVGLVSDFEESMQVATTQSINRSFMVTCVGLKFFMDSPSYYSLIAASALNVLIPENSTSSLAGLGSMLTLSSLTNAPPTQVAYLYYTAPFKDGAGIGISQIVNQNQSVIPVSQAISLFSWDTVGFIIPNAMYLNIQAQTWSDGISQFLEWPMYEWFLMTLPSNPYPGFPGQNQSNQAQGFAVSSDYLNGYPTLIMRPNPFPTLSDPNTADTSLWNTLPIFEPTYAKFGYIREEAGFAIGQDTTNVFFVNPIAAQTALAGSQEDFTSIIYALFMGYSMNSIQHYGYRPFVWTTNYFWRGDQKNGGGGNIDVDGAIQQLILRAASWGLSTPYCAHGGVVFDLRPDIYPGTIFQFAPFRDGALWQFYIVGVEHSFSPNGSSTSLQLERGLPVEVYDNPQLLASVLNGSAVKVDGQYQTGSNGLQISTLTQSTLIQNLLQAFNENYSKPKQ